ncbi:DUF4124 domain-containing protein [Azohydromonas sp.]|mgnify:CR=1 FL=1|uniref:DUF4124 domain-containing protein n=1 Tax=Azohydromonas sp. TaxID=1872666 RepID=UPI002CCFD048|nr:DUF4124 domain-containing protein [Azohydromonas sp.]HMM86143.1 DUF4124 domain-containing protein [Azohydromonas sp.]
MRVPLLVIALSLLAAAGDATAQWKWRDRAGQIHISDLPPPRDVPERDVLQRPAQPATARANPAAEAASAPAAASAVSEAKPRTDPELEARRKAAEQEQQAREQQAQRQLAAQRAENCQRARDSLRQLDSGMRLARVNDKGERVILDDRQRAAEAQRAREVIASDCR